MEGSKIVKFVYQQVYDKLILVLRHWHSELSRCAKFTGFSNYEHWPPVMSPVNTSRFELISAEHCTNSKIGIPAARHRDNP